MKNLEKMRKMDAKELVNYLEQICSFLNSCPPPLLGSRKCPYQRCNQCWIAWLNEESEE